MSEYGNGFSLAYWEGVLRGCQEETHALEKAVGMELGESRISSRVRQFAALLDRAKQQEQRLRELESLLRQALDVLEHYQGNYKLGRHTAQYVLDLTIALRKQLKEPPR